MNQEPDKPMSITQIVAYALLFFVCMAIRCNPGDPEESRQREEAARKMMEESGVR